MSTATKYADPIRISTGNATRTIGIPVGSPNSALNVSVAALAKSLSALLGRATEVRSHTAMLPSERTDRLDRLRPEAVKAVRAHLATLESESARIAHLARTATASVVKPSSMLEHHKVLEDLALAQRFAALPISEKTRVVAEAIRDPAANLRWAEMLQRVAPELSGADRAMLQELRLSTLRTFDPELLASVEAQQEQVTLAQRAADIAQQLLAENFVGSLQELQAEPAAPETPAALTAADYLSAVSEEALADLRSGPGLSRPSRVELSRVQA